MDNKQPNKQNVRAGVEEFDRDNVILEAAIV